MEVPQSYGVVGWYNKGAMPGEKGPAVLAGHFTGGYGGVFDKLTDVKDGDLITMTNGKGESFTYKVTKKVEYEKDKVPMAELFKPSNESRLEIITCSGKWQAQNYDKRLVVTAEIVR
jgi:LPXTG-site transpeptidase (sortase) family protein